MWSRYLVPDKQLNRHYISYAINNPDGSIANFNINVWCLHISLKILVFSPY